MDDLIHALMIFRKYSDTQWPTHCEHDVLTVNINPEIVSEEDIALLSDLGFFTDDDDENFKSYAFGSC